MPLFHLDWYRCLDGYRIEEQASPPREQRAKRNTVLEGIGGGRVIVPNSSQWEEIRPLQVPGAYRPFANWDGGEDGLLKLTNAYGFLISPKAKAEHVDHARTLISRVAWLVAAIDRQDWHLIAHGLSRAGQHRVFATGGVGILGVLFDVSENRPIMKLRPANLAAALQVQALADVSFGIEHRKCKNPECDEYFPVRGPDAYRSDAEYHSEACRRRHAYLSKKKERRL